MGAPHPILDRRPGESDYARKARVEGERTELVKRELAEEYMAACALPLLTFVGAPTDLDRLRRSSLIDVFGQELDTKRNRGLCGQVIAILMRDEGGRKVLETLAEQHGENFADALVATCDLEGV